MEILLALVLLGAVVALVHRWSIATRGQRLADPPGPNPTPVPGHLPLRARHQMDRALRARRTYVEPQHLPRHIPQPRDGSHDPL